MTFYSGKPDGKMLFKAAVFLEIQDAKNPWVIPASLGNDVASTALEVLSRLASKIKEM